LQDEDIDKEESYFSTSIKDLFAKNKPLQCSVVVENEEGVVSMNYYFDNKNERFRVHSEFIDRVGGLNFNSSGILTDDWYYFWDDLMNIDGMKIKTNDDPEITDNEDNLNMDEHFDFKCKSWKVDNSFFDLPKDKSFKDLSGTLDNFNNSLNPSESNQESIQNLDFSVDSDTDICSVCYMLPEGSDRDECLATCSQ
jgi:hypothetical protein